MADAHKTYLKVMPLEVTVLSHFLNSKLQCFQLDSCVNYMVFVNPYQPGIINFSHQDFYLHYIYVYRKLLGCHWFVSTLVSVISSALYFALSPEVQMPPTYDLKMFTKVHAK